MSNEKLMETLAPEKKQSPLSTFKTLLENNKQQLINALPKHLTADRIIRLACTEFSKNKEMQACDMKSICGAIMQASQLGLEIGLLGQAYLVPFMNGKTGKKECQFIPGYKGLLSLARRSGELSSLETNIVYTNDKFDLKLGINAIVVHEPYLEGDRGEPRIVYGVAKFKDGGHHFEWMSIAEVNKIRSRSKASGSSYSPWNTDYDQMIRKTLIRRMSNYLPMSIELQNAIQISDAVEDGKKAYLDSEVVFIEDMDEVKEKEEKVIKNEEIKS